VVFHNGEAILALYTMPPAHDGIPCVEAGFHPARSFQAPRRPDGVACHDFFDFAYRREFCLQADSEGFEFDHILIGQQALV
jgi:hypothetical protein